MLGNIDLNKKSYEQILEEAIAQIPIYSKDWTNYNISDPGITILENLSAFSALLQSEINEVPEKTRFRLLELAGFTPRKGKAACAYISAKMDKEDRTVNIPKGAKLYAQDICFEFEENDADIIVKNKEITKIEPDMGLGENINQLLTYEGVKGGVFLLGEKPLAGNMFYLYLNDIPYAGEKAAIHFEMEKNFMRNSFADKKENPFAEVTWEIKTQEGFKELCIDDDTYCFMQSGYVKFCIGKELYDEIKAYGEYVIRITLDRADYDIVPRFDRICGVLTQVIQKDTKSFIEIKEIDNTDNTLTLENYILNNGYPEIYGMESDGIYRRYFDNSQRGENRYCHIEPVGKYRIKAVFENNVPSKVMAVYRDTSVMAYRSLGRLYGYDEQILGLPPMEKVYSSKFSVIIVQKNFEGDEACHIAYPESDIEGEVKYSLSENDNNIIIHDCGKYEGAEVRLGAYGIYMGAAADVIPDIQMNMSLENNSELIFINIASGERGYYGEDFEELRKQFVKDIKTPVTMVTKEDCVQTVKSVPGLSIHKIGISTNSRKNEIYVVVKPNSFEPFPKMSDIYINEVKKYLEKYRMLTTTVIVEQPIYVPVNVSGMIYTKKYFKNSRENIENKIKDMLDGVNSEAGFGSRIVFHEIYEKLQELDCVDEIVELNIFPDSYKYVELTGLDMKLASNALFYPGKISLEITDI
jgi:hypothetical protein